jgi:CRISPR system Cascade subunit CasD
MLACALGLERGDPDIKRVSASLSVASRADRPGVLLQDFHTITGLIRTAQGDQRGNKGEDSTILSVRQYLQDASFLVAISGPEILLKQCEVALKDPKWPLFLGRKSCVPSLPILLGISKDYFSIEEAMFLVPLAKRSKGAVMYESAATVGGTLRPDEILDAKKRLYRYRRVSLKPATREN